ncbi:MAG: chemotaxis protein CheW, partial [Rickettsiales bacterium]
YIVPINNIVESMRPRAEAVQHVADGTTVINVRGEFIPVLYLYRLFNVKNACRDAHKALVVLVESGTQTIGLVVDELVGQQQVVIKTLEENTDPIPGISGATILGDGKVSLILDTGALAALTHAPDTTPSPLPDEPPQEEKDAA